MTMLTAQDAICSTVARVMEDMRACDLGVKAAGYQAYAVFTTTDSEPFSGDFLGLVSQRRVHQYPLRIFADLLAFPAIAPVERKTPLAHVFERFDLQQLEILPVINHKREFFGAVTRQSLFETMLNRERQKANELEKEVVKGKRLQKELLSAIAKLNQQLSQQALNITQDHVPVTKLDSVLTDNDQAYVNQLLNVSRVKLFQARRTLAPTSDSESLLQEIDQVLQELRGMLTPEP